MLVSWRGVWECVMSKQTWGRSISVEATKPFSKEFLEAGRFCFHWFLKILPQAVELTRNEYDVVFLYLLIINK